MRVLKCHEISLVKRLEIVFCRNTDDSYNKIATIGGYSKSLAFSMCKNLFKSRAVKHLIWVGRPEKLTKIFESHATLPVLELLMCVHTYAFISGEFATFYVSESKS